MSCYKSNLYYCSYSNSDGSVLKIFLNISMFQTLKKMENDNRTNKVRSHVYLKPLNLSKLSNVCCRSKYLYFRFLCSPLLFKFSL